MKKRQTQNQSKRIKRSTTLSKVLLILFIPLFIAVFYLIFHFAVKADVADSALDDSPSNYYAQVYYSGAYHRFMASAFSVNKRPVYCIDLGIGVAKNVYSSTTNLSTINISKDKLERLKLLAYYGYGYKDHQKDMAYYIATQELIWSLLSPSTEPTYWNTELYSNYHLDISSYKNEILDLVNNHSKLPNIATNIDAKVGETLELIDSNNKLSNYTTTDPNVTIEGNKLTIKLPDDYIGNYQITLKTPTEYNYNYTLYYYQNYQRLFSAGKLDEGSNTLTININVTGANIDFYKYDLDKNVPIPSGEASLTGATYELYNRNKELIDTIKTDQNAHATIKNLPLGTYYIKEISPSPGYLLNPELKEIKIDKIDNEVIIYEQVIKSKLEILKLFGSSETDILLPEPNITFKIFDNKNNLYTSLTTNDNGEGSVDLPYGTYNIKQDTILPGYEKVEDIIITINEESPPIIRYNFFNKQINPCLKLIKIDSSSNQTITLSHTKFKLKNKNTNQYITYKDKYTNTTIDTFETNDEGFVIIPVNLSYGDYIVEEVSSPKGYTAQDITITINQKSQLIKDDNYGYLVTIEVPNTPLKYKLSLIKTGDLFAAKNGTFYYDKIALENITFNLYAQEDIVTADNTIHFSKDSIIKENVSTNKDGKLTIDDLYPGSYCLVETSTIKNYLLDDTPHCFEITTKDYILKIHNNLQTGSLIVSKKDYDTNNILKGAIIELYTENGVLINTSMSNEEGLIKIDKLPLGKYYLKEKQAPTNYDLDLNSYYFTIDSENQLVTLTITNKKHPNTTPVLTGINKQISTFSKLPFIISGISLFTLIIIFKKLIKLFLNHSIK